MTIMQQDKCGWDGKTINHWSLQWWATAQTSDENYGNHPLEDVDLMCQQILRTLMSTEMKDSEGELTVWTLKVAKDTTSVKIYLLLYKAKIS